MLVGVDPRPIQFPAVSIALSTSSYTDRAAESCANLLLNPGFEHPEPTTAESGRFATGQWEGDTSLIVTARDGIVPYQGTRMLRCEQTLPGSGGLTLGCQVFQVVDLAALRDKIEAGGLQLQGSFRANRIDGDPAVIDTEFRIGFLVYDGDILGFDVNTATPIDSSYVSVLTDGDTETWELVSQTYTLPSQTTFVVVDIGPVENVLDQVGLNELEFEGHYLDDAKLIVLE